MKQLIAALLAAGIAMNAVSALAQEEKEERPWSLAAELGLTLTTGNAKTRAIDGGLEGGYEHGAFKHTAEMSVLFGASEDSATGKVETTDKRFEVEAKSEWSFTEHQYLYALVGYENDAFASYRQRASESLGYGVKLIAEDDLRVQLEGGPAMRHTQPQGYTCSPPMPFVVCNREFETEFTGRAALNAEWDISDTAVLKEKVESTFGPKEGGGIVTKSVTSLKAKVNTSLALKAEFEVRHVSEIPPGATTKDVDTKTTVKFVYDF